MATVGTKRRAVILWWLWTCCIGSVSGAQDRAQQECSADGSSDGSCAANNDDETTPQQQPALTALGSYELLETVPHDPDAFTQGLEMYNATHMYESVGLYGKSRVRLVEIATGRVVQETPLDKAYFAEGMTRCAFFESNDVGTAADSLIVLTWKELTGLVLDPKTLEIRSTFRYTTTNGEGWGIACDADQQRLYVTDGTAFLHVWNAKGEEVSKVHVHYLLPQPGGGRHQQQEPEPKVLNHINELEMMQDDKGRTFVLANVWYQDVLVRIHPLTGLVHTIYDLSTLRPKHVRGPHEDCLNGIARDVNAHDVVYWVTGKQWPYMYKIRLLEAAAAS